MSLPDHPILKLTPQEKAAYSHLFSLADSDSLGVVTGERAVAFFEKTHVPANVLGEIWQIADTENRGLLTKPGFCMVLRLIGWYQGGSQPSTELAFKPAPLPKFDGISLPQAPQGTGQQPQSPTAGQFPQGALQPQLSGQGPIRVPPLDPNKVQQYSGLFERSGANNGLLDGASAKGIFEKAGLPNEVLGRIWMLSDREQRGALDQTEFIIAMHLLTSMKTKAMSALPNTLPQGLYDAAARRGQGPPSRQSSVPTGGPAGMPRQLTGSQPQRAQSPLARPPGYSTPPPVSAQTTGAPWIITQQEKSQYDRFFATIDTSSSGIVSGEQAVRFFSDSRLPEETLASIWDLADINSEGQLNKDEFAVAMYLIRQQRVPNAPPLPAFLPPALIPPSMRGQQQSQQSTAPAFDTANAPPQPPAQKSASEDLFGLDSSPTQPQQPTLQPQGTGASASRDPFGGSQPASPSSPQRFQAQPTGGSTMFKPFMPTSAFGASLAQQHTGQSATSSQGQPQQQQAQSTGFAQQRATPATTDDLLGDNDTHAEESSKLTNESTELANMSNQIGNLRNQMEATQSKKSATSAELNATNQQKQQLEQRLQQFRTQYEAEVRAVKEMEQQLAASKESTKKLGQELAMVEGTYQDLHTQHQTVSQQLQADQQENANLKQRIAQINAEVAALKPQIEKMKLDARQQKGMVSINKKQLSTNEGEKNRLESERADLEREAADTARSAAASPEPVQTQQSNVASPAGSAVASTNPFFRMASNDGVTDPPAQSASGPTPSAFDALFGPSSHFAPSGQAGSRTGTPPATSFIGRSVPAAAAAGIGGAAVGAGGMAMADSMSSAGEPTPSATPPLSDNAKESPVASEQPPPPPPESRQFTPTNLPIAGGVAGAQSDAGDSTNVVPPASRAGEVETPGGLEREAVPGAFPDDEAQPTTSAQEVSSTPGLSTQSATPAATTKTTDDFDSAFAGFGGGQSSKDASSNADDPFAATQSEPQQRGFNSEFPPIQNLESDDDSSSDDGSDTGGFGDDFTRAGPSSNEAASNPPNNGTEALRPSVASGDDIAAIRPGIKSMESTASDLPPVNKETSPPSYEQSDAAAQGGSGERTASNSFPPQFGNLLPAREDPTSPPPPATSPPVDDAASAASTLQPNDTGTQSVVTPSTDTFVDAFSRPMSTATDTSAPNATAPATETLSKAPQAPTAPKNAFDDFDDFADLSEAREADDKNASDFDFGFGSGARESTDDFNPAFDTPAQNTPMTRSVQPSQDSTNGGTNSFAAFAPSQSTTSPFGGSTGGNSSVQQTPQNVQHDWDAIFSGLDSSKAPDTSLGGNDDPWGTSVPADPITTSGPAGAVNGDASTSAPSGGLSGAAAAKGKDMGRAITPGTEHDDPILKRLTTMGYPRQDALNALEMFDYDINKVSR